MHFVSIAAKKVGRCVCALRVVGMKTKVDEEEMESGGVMRRREEHDGKGRLYTFNSLLHSP